MVSNTPAFPKKVPIVLIATIATLLLSTAFITTGELLAGNVYRPADVALAASVPTLVSGDDPALPIAQPAAGNSANAPAVAQAALDHASIDDPRAAAHKAIADLVEALHAQTGERPAMAAHRRSHIAVSD